MIKAMVNIPMKVQTKTLAFTDPTGVANDRLTGETSVIAFRATALKNVNNDDTRYNTNKPGICFLKLFSFKLIRISQWNGEMLITILEIFLMGHILPFQKTDFTPFTPAAIKIQATME